MLGLTKTSDYNTMRDDRDAVLNTLGFFRNGNIELQATVHKLQQDIDDRDKVIEAQYEAVTKMEVAEEEQQKRERQILAVLGLRTTWHDEAMGKVVALQERLDELYSAHGKVLKERDTLSAKYNFIKDTLQTVIEND